MHLIVGTKTLPEIALRRIPGGYEAEAAGEALMRLIDASFAGASIEVTGTPSGHVQGLDVTDIRMAGATTTVTLMKNGARAVH
ncbi:hypothetical protein CKO11_04285 [Rhodobacter sp. TJ_12]|uniref:hypothetical protein n=1 Tax=Rhodobacter sp. TJ_12 TaxID=2029399 RepID=UPI001CBB0C52|nr:hypothetical protein [Rhodobacter sp. TJ_12]MBZ4021678.1 hypothetical protein [Rhodobacter sp. TJ_12]